VWTSSHHGSIRGFGSPDATPRQQAKDHHMRLTIGAGMLLLIALVAILAPWLAPHDPNAQDLLNTLLPPAWTDGGSVDFPFGTDSLGRCILSRLIYGTRVAVIVASLAPLGAGLLGGALALLAGYCGGWVDWLILRAIDIWMSIPPIVLALLLIIGLSPSLRNVIIAIIAVDWTRFCRVARSEAIVLRRREYVTAARILGASHFHVAMWDILPGVFPVLATLFGIEMSISIVAESIMSFIGLSAAPSIPTWGMMLADGLNSAFQEPWGLIFPTLCIAVTVLSANLMADGVRRTFDPRLAGRSVA
jgi:peptide/nickel transport system permease protein